MKIGIDIRTLMDTHYSGVPEYTLNLVKGIIEKDKHNDYVLFYNSFKNLDDHIPRFKGENVRFVKTKYPNKIFNYLLQKGIKKPKIDELLNVDMFFMPHINFSSLSNNVKKIITIHDLSFLRYPKFFSTRKNIWHKLIDVKKLVKKFDIVVAVSENTKRDLIELCMVPEEKIKVIHSGIEESFKKISIDASKRNKLQKKYKLPRNYILYLGTIEPRKNVDGIIKAYELYRKNNKIDIKLVIAGANGWKSSKIFKTWNNSEYKDDIIFLGFVDREDKIFLYNLAKVFVYPSFYEGFGFPPLEAIACGVPVITSNVSSLPEVSGRDAIYVDPYKVNEISHAFSLILNNKNQKLASDITKENVLDKYSWDRVIDEYLELFKY